MENENREKRWRTIEEEGRGVREAYKGRQADFPGRPLHGTEDYDMIPGSKMKQKMS